MIINFGVKTAECRVDLIFIILKKLLYVPLALKVTKYYEVTKVENKNKRSSELH